MPFSIKTLIILNLSKRSGKKYDREEIAILRLILYDGAKKKIFKVKKQWIYTLAIQTTLKGLEVPLFWQKREVNIDQRLKAILDVLFYGIVLKWGSLFYKSGILFFRLQ